MHPSTGILFVSMPNKYSMSVGLVHHFCIAHNREVCRHKNVSLRNYSFGRYIQKEQDRESPPPPLPKINLLVQISGEI